jgi:hypothetical protein
LRIPPRGATAGLSSSATLFRINFCESPQETLQVKPAAVASKSSLHPVPGAMDLGFVRSVLYLPDYSVSYHELVQDECCNAAGLFIEDSVKRVFGAPNFPRDRTKCIWEQAATSDHRCTFCSEGGYISIIISIQLAAANNCNPSEGPFVPTGSPSGATVKGCERSLESIYEA